MDVPLSIIIFGEIRQFSASQPTIERNCNRFPFSKRNLALGEVKFRPKEGSRYLLHIDQFGISQSEKRDIELVN